MLVLRFLNGTTIRREHWRPHVGRLGALLSLSTLSAFPYPRDLLSSAFLVYFPSGAACKTVFRYGLITGSPNWTTPRLEGWISERSSRWISSPPAQNTSLSTRFAHAPCRGHGRGRERQPLGNLKHTDSLHANKWPFILVSFSFKLASTLEKCKSPSALPWILHGGFRLIIVALYVAHLLLVRSQLFNSIRYIYTAK